MSSKSMVQQLRDIRDRIDRETKGMTYEQIRKHMKIEKSLFLNEKR